MSLSTLTQENKNNAPTLKTGAAPAADKMKGTAQELASSAAQVASDVGHKAQDWASNVAGQAQETAAAALDKTNDGIAAAGRQLNSFGGTVRDIAPKDGMVGSAATAVADNLQAGGRYLEEHGVQDMGKDLTTMVRHYPIQSVLVGFGLGCLLGAMLRRR